MGCQTLIPKGPNFVLRLSGVRGNQTWQPAEMLMVQPPGDCPRFMVKTPKWSVTNQNIFAALDLHTSTNPAQLSPQGQCCFADTLVLAPEQLTSLQILTQATNLGKYFRSRLRHFCDSRPVFQKLNPFLTWRPQVSHLNGRSEVCYNYHSPRVFDKYK